MRRVIIPLAIIIPLWIAGMLLLDEFGISEELGFAYLVLCCITSIAIQCAVIKYDGLRGKDED